MRNHRFQSDECARHNLDLTAFRELVVEFPNFATHAIPKLCQNAIFDGRIVIAELDNSADTVCMPDQSLHVHQSKVGEKITRKHCLSNPKKASAAYFSVPDSGPESSNALNCAKATYRKVLLPGF